MRSPLLDSSKPASGELAQPSWRAPDAKILGAVVNELAAAHSLMRWLLLIETD
jgi:hypothetical protein